MSLWTEIQLLPSSYLQQIRDLYIYGDFFPIEGRKILAQWIEQKIKEDLSIDNCIHINSFVEDLLWKLNEEIYSTDDIERKTFLNYMVNQLKLMEPLQIYTKICQMLKAEIDLVRSSKSDELPEWLNSLELILRIKILEIHMKNTSKMLNDWKQNIVVFDLLESSLRMSIDELELIRKSVIYEIKLFECEQQRASNGTPMKQKIDILQQWCEKLLRLIWNNHNIVNETKHILYFMSPLQVQNALTSLNIYSEKLTCLELALCTSTLVIEEQPSPIILKGSVQRNKVSLRYLVGGLMELNLNPPEVKLHLINEREAVEVYKNHPVTGVTGVFKNNKATMVINVDDNSNKTAIVNFPNLKLKTVNRKKCDNQLAAEEKFCIYFKTKVWLRDREVKIHAVSNPVVVIVNMRIQSPQAEGTILWDSINCQPNRIPFIVPDRCHWNLVENGLKDYFALMLNIEKNQGLTDQHCRLLDKLALRNNSANEITWNQFNKMSLSYTNVEGIASNLGFTFWIWFHSIVKLIKNHLIRLWIDGLIIGFISRLEAERLLANKCTGTFLLRFTDSKLGGITIAFVDKEGKVNFSCPEDSKSLGEVSLPDRIKNYSQCKILFPDIPKHQAFSKYFSPEDSPAMPIPNPGYPFKTETNAVMTKIQGFVKATQFPLWNPNSPNQTQKVPSSPKMEQPINSINNSENFDYGNYKSHFKAISYEMDVEDSLFDDLDFTQFKTFDVEDFLRQLPH